MRAFRKVLLSFVCSAAALGVGCAGGSATTAPSEPQPSQPASTTVSPTAAAAEPARLPVILPGPGQRGDSRVFYQATLVQKPGIRDPILRHRFFLLHSLYFARADDRGQIQFSGMTGQIDGFVYLLNVRDEDAARALIEGSPFYRSGEFDLTIQPLVLQSWRAELPTAEDQAAMAKQPQRRRDSTRPTAQSQQHVSLKL